MAEELRGHKKWIAEQQTSQNSRLVQNACEIENVCVFTTWKIGFEIGNIIKITLTSIVYRRAM